jgi:glycosyltransferase involved in cell wall biosynthesis
MRDETLRKTPQQTPVSCIMPTYNRREFVPHAIRYFLRQDYEPRELIIIDDGTDPVEDLVPPDGRIRYYRLNKKITLGAKLNMACQYAKGTIIAHWDDDDWYAPRRLTYQVETLMREGTDICGINKLLYLDIRGNRAYQYIYPANQRTWLLGSTLCYTRQHWTGSRFADIDVGMDGLFVWAARPDRITVLQDETFSVFMIHPHNVSPKKTGGAWWHPYPVEEIRKILQSDWEFYRPEPQPEETPPAVPAGISDREQEENKVETSAKPVRNVFACLVHENPGCVIDLVRNLKYLDPSSQILLYNGGTDKNLLKNFPFERYGAVIIPGSRHLKWGRLHDFALDCMKYSINNLSFDILTIVDSDQLCVGRNYSHYMAKHLNPGENIGMFGITEERQTHHTKVEPAVTAYKEIELWKPFLERFTHGIDKFLYWTFWPSTVFTKAAAADLVKLFDNDRQLKAILQKTKIWASEEIILPTLVSLLGYKIKKNPCSYDYVKYRRKYSSNDIRSALNQPDVFWVHPVPRRCEDKMRRHICAKLNHYERVSRSGYTGPAYELNGNPGLLLTIPILEAMNKVEGWLDEDEADLLIAAARRALELPQPHSIVEIGSYHGRSTIVLGSVVKAVCPKVKVYAIDPHDGRLGAMDQGIRLVPPSLGELKRNIKNADLADEVEIIHSRPLDVSWDRSISMLFIDGLHDYLNVAGDFWHFAKWVRPGGLAAFHDYADYYPGVLTFVNELLSLGEYQLLKKVKSLVILEKKISPLHKDESQS